MRGRGSADTDAEWYVGVDVGRKRDSTAIVAVAMIDDVLHVRARLLVPAPDRPVAVAVGSTSDHDEVTMEHPAGR